MPSAQSPHRSRAVAAAVAACSGLAVAGSALGTEPRSAASASCPVASSADWADPASSGWAGPASSDWAVPASFGSAARAAAEIVVASSAGDYRFDPSSAAAD